MGTIARCVASASVGARLVSAAALVFLLGACSGTAANVGAAPQSPAVSSPVATTPSPAPAGVNVAVVEKEFSIALDKASFIAGDYTFAVQNQGSFPHNLTIRGPGVDSKASPTLGVGQSGVLTAALQKGSYELSCSVPGHKDRGMDIKITVG